MTKDNTYFSVHHPFVVYLEPWDNTQAFPNADELREFQSTGLRLVNDVKLLEADCLFHLRQMEIDAKPVVDYLKLQSRKIDLVLQFMLEQASYDGQAYTGIKFGGSGFHIQSSTPVDCQCHYKATLFIHDELISLICIVKPLSCEQIDKQNYNVECEFTVIQATDIEQLVQASLHVQQKLLQTKQQIK